MAEAEAQEYGVHMLAVWVRTTSDDGPFGRQPYRKPQGVPAGFQLPSSELAQPWHQ